MSVIKPQEINLDFSQNSYKDIVVKQNDVNSRTVIVTCTDNGIICSLDRVSQTCNIRMNTPDNRIICNPTTILSDGRVQIEFTEQMTLVSGKVDAELEVIDQPSQEIIHSMTMHVIVVANVYPNDEIVASSEFDALNKALLAVQDCTELVNSVNEIETNEAARVENEAKREAEFAEMKETVDAVDEHYNSIASTTNLGHVKIDGETITIDENGVIHSAGYGDVPDGVIYVDFENNDEVILPEGGSGGFNEIYAETSINLGRAEDTTIGEYSATIGSEGNVAISECSVAIGHGNEVNNQYSMAFGRGNKISASSSVDIGGSFVSGYYNELYINQYNTAFGYQNIINPGGTDSYHGNSTGGMVVGVCNKLTGYCSFAQGWYNEVSEDHCAAMGDHNIVSGNNSFAFGGYNKATGNYSYAIGYETTASGLYSYAEGYKTISSGYSSHTEGYNTKASGQYSHTEGDSTTASKDCSHAEGKETIANGNYSHTEGCGTRTEESNAHAEGYYTTAKGYCSHSEGYYTIASGQYQHVQGIYNIEDTEGKYAHIVGNGTSSARANIHTLDWDGNAWFAGDVSNNEGKSLSASIQLSKDAEGNIDYGTKGQFLVSNGDGTFSWMSLAIAEGGAY